MRQVTINIPDSKFPMALKLLVDAMPRGCTLQLGDDDKVGGECDGGDESEDPADEKPRAKRR